MLEPPDISVIVVNWNTRLLLAQCLASIEDDALARPGLRVEMLVVDNASTDGSPAMVRQEFPHAWLWINEENRGFAAANNLALAQAGGRLVFLLNSDAYLVPGALGAVADFMATHPEATVVGTRVLNPDGTVQASCFCFPNLWDVCCEMFFLSAIFPENPFFNRRGLGGFDRLSVREVDWVSGAAMGIRREWIQKVGALDEGYFMNAEELDWCRRTRQAGGRVFFFPGAEVVHHGGASSASARAMILPRAFASRFRYYQRFHGLAYAWTVRGITALGMGLRLVAQSLLVVTRRGKSDQARENWHAYWNVLLATLR
jgi:N-acetylglucosaminyl-diphospho-decaprenol L-rhamnosyltransferase